MKRIVPLFMIMLVFSCDGTESEIQSVIDDPSLDDPAAINAITSITSRIFASIESDAEIYVVEMEDGSGYGVDIIINQSYNGTYFDTVEDFCQNIEDKLAKILWRTLRYGHTRGLNAVTVTFTMPMEGIIQTIYSAGMLYEDAKSIDGFNTADPYETDSEFDMLMGDALAVANQIKFNWQVLQEDCYGLEMEM